MLDRSNKKLILGIIITLFTIVILDLMTIVTNLYIAPYLDGYGLPDILIYIKTAVFMTTLVVLMIWRKNKDYRLTKSTLRTLMTISFGLLFFYFFSLYMYKYVLLLDVTEIIRTKILDGNPALVFEFTGRNYVVLNYINTIYGGFNSELFLGVELLIIQMFLIKTKSAKIVDENEVKYDGFLFDISLLPISVLLVIAGFTSINLFEFKYTSFEAAMMVVAITAFIVTIPSIPAAVRIYKSQHTPVKKTDFVSWYRLLKFVSIGSMVLFAALFGFHIYSVTVLEISTYRILTTLISFILAAIIYFKTIKIMSLENK